jgi:hypothetical protein
LIFEPGRLLVGNAGILVTRVLYLKRGEAKTFVIVDAAMNDLIRPTLYEAHHEIVPVRAAAAGARRIRADVVGPVCESGDFLALQRDMAETRSGDLLAVMSAGAYGMASRSKALRYSLATVLIVVSTYGVDLGRHLIATPKGDFGKLDGMAAITSDPIERAVLAYLRAQPRGIVLQRPETGAFTPAPALVLFSGQQAFFGWAAHERLWRGQRADVDLRVKEVAAFYAGEMPESLQWLLVNRIDHVLWLKSEMKQPAAAFGRINDAIGPAYDWHEFYRAGDFRVGIWTRVPFNTVPRAARP